MIQLKVGDCISVMASMEENSVDAIVTDPPYGLEFMGKDWDSPWKTDRRQIFDGTLVDDRENPFKRSKVRYGVGGSYGADANIMVAFQEWNYLWAEQALRVLKPGGHMLAFGGTRTYHRMVCAIEDAGFEIRDCIMWVHGQGFPKSHDLSKAIDKTLGFERDVVGAREAPGFAKSNVMHGAQTRTTTQFVKTSEDAISDEADQWRGWGTALKPAVEPVVIARKPLSEKTIAANVLKWGTGALNIDGCRIDSLEPVKTHSRGSNGAFPKRPGEVSAEESGRRTDQRSGLDTNTERSGRWPANLCHNGSDEVLECFPESKGQQGDVKGTEKSRTGGDGTNCYGEYGRIATQKRGDSGSAARFFFNARNDEESAMRTYEESGATNFAAKPGMRREPTEPHRLFYCAKASKADRMGSNHPTVKPRKLMKWLITLITPPDGIVLDPFAGSGSTGWAADELGFDCILIERDEGYAKHIGSVIRLLDEEKMKAETNPQVDLFHNVQGEK